MRYKLFCCLFRDRFHQRTPTLGFPFPPSLHTPSPHSSASPSSPSSSSPASCSPLLCKLQQCERFFLGRLGFLNKLENGTSVRSKFLLCCSFRPSSSPSLAAEVTHAWDGMDAVGCGVVWWGVVGCGEVWWPFFNMSWHWTVRYHTPLHPTTSHHTHQYHD
ncbi:unnamed protein product [Closterium sp. NIES-53]